jgi:cyclohexanecarboxyl-CoA dehydrogenase
LDFTLTDTQKEYQEKARRLAVERLAPEYQEREKRRYVEKELRREMGALGLIAPEISEDLGGRGLDRLTDGIIAEEIARGDFNVAYVQIVGSLVGQILSGYAQGASARFSMKLIIARQRVGRDLAP